MPKTINVLPIAQTVMVKLPDTTCLLGTVIRIMVSNDGVQYETAWWDGTTRKLEWLNDFEIELLDDARQQTIGFIQP